MTAHVRQGRIEPDEPLDLPEGTTLRLMVVEAPEAAEEFPTLLERLRPLVGSIDDLPEDFADQHDHYIHGSARR